jgi:hypothetical protein
MAPTLVLSIGFAIDGTPTSLYCGNDFSAAQTAAQTAGVTGSYVTIQLFRNLVPIQEFRFPPA